MLWVIGLEFADQNNDIRVILRLFWDNGKQNGNYHSILGLYWDNEGCQLEASL